MTDEKDDQDVAPESSFDKFVRDGQGRFAKAEETPEPAPPAAPAPKQDEPPAPPQSTSQQQPAVEQPNEQPQAGKQWADAALLDEREKRRQERERAEKEAARANELERRLREFEEKQKQQAKPIPDPIADPEGYNARLEEQRARDKQDLIFRFSEQFAIRQHGADVVKQAMEWLGQELAANPGLWSVIERDADPADHVVQLHKRHLRSVKLGDFDPDDYAKQWAERNGYVPQRPAAQQGAPAAGAPSPQPPKPPPPKPSIASAPAAAPVAAQDHAYNEAEVFKGLFGKK